MKELKENGVVAEDHYEHFNAIFHRNENREGYEDIPENDE